jgi:hypothetical protein
MSNESKYLSRRIKKEEVMNLLFSIDMSILQFIKVGNSSGSYIQTEHRAKSSFSPI